MKTIFEKIIDKEMPASIVYEDEICIAILDRFPIYTGQTLVIPKQPVDYIFDLDDKTYQHIFYVAKKISKALDKKINTFKTCLLVEGLEVNHAHIKLYPITKPELEIHGGKRASDEELKKVAEKIKDAISE